MRLPNFLRSFIGDGLLRRLLSAFVGQQPAPRLIRHTLRRQWRLLAYYVGTSLVQAFSEGATIGLIFLSVQLLTNEQPIAWASHPFFSRLPPALWPLESLPRPSLFLLFLALALAMQALQSMGQYINSVSLGYFMARCRSLITASIYSRILSFSFPCASHYRVGDLINYATSASDSIRVQLETASSLSVNILLAFTYLIILLTISPALMLAGLILAIAIATLQKKLMPLIALESQRLTGLNVEISSRITEDIQALRLLHTTGTLDSADRSFRASMKGLEESLRRQTRYIYAVAPVSSFLPILAIVIISALSLFLFSDRSTGVIPSLITFILSLQRLNARVVGIAQNATTLAGNTANIDRLNDILSTDGKAFRRTHGIPFVGLRREIRFQHVSLRYSPELQPAIWDLDLVVPRGQVTALVGSSGAGKSSIIDLLVGLYSPSSGRILIDDLDLESIELASWQQRLGVVSQDTFLFNATIAENISYGFPDATRSQIHNAASLAQAVEFIEQLPEGFNTRIGERGYRLSGGQRQRLALARAILRNPDLLILDEATSALDSRNERLIQDALRRFQHDHTLLVVAHRLSTIMHADTIYVLDEGRIVERGRHEQLLSREGLYASLWTQQMRMQSVPS